MLNKIILMGRLTRDPELRRTESRYRRLFVFNCGGSGLQVQKRGKGDGLY